MGDVKFVIDKAQMLNLGGGNVMEFCRRYGFDYNLLQHVIRKKYTRNGTKSQEMVERLIKMGVGKYVNVTEEEAVDGH